MSKQAARNEVYSRYWRKNRSRDEVTELAFTLKALRKVAGHIGRNVKPIYWKGMTDACDSSILLDPAQVSGVYPIPFKKLDYLVGQVVLEAVSSIEWSEWVRKRVFKRICDVPEEERRFLEYLIDAAEGIYVHELVRPHICWPHYLSTYWKNTLRKDQRDPTLPPSPASLANIWKRKAIMDELPDSLHHYYDRPLELLQKYTDNIRHIAAVSAPHARREMRIDLYEQMCRQIHGAITEWEKFKPDPSFVNLRDEGADRTEENNDGDEEKEKDRRDENPSDGLEPELANKVRSILEDEDTDLTEEVALAVEAPEAGSMETVFRQGIVKSQIIPDEVQVKRLRKIFLMQETLIRRTRKRRMRRGLIQGKIDSRRLFRVPIDGKIFKYRETPNSEVLWNIVIVADASASMGGRRGRIRPWDFAEKTFVSLAEAAKSSRNHLEIYAYHEKAGQCILTCLYRGSGEIYTVIPGGRTPSGQAIAAAAMVLKKTYKKSIIVHITDGAANCGLKLDEAIQFCQKNDIQVVTIGCGCNQQTQDFLKACFPVDKLCFMDHITGLADGLEGLFKQKILRQIPG